MIDGVIAKKLVIHADERGSFHEIIRLTDEFFREGFGQWSMSRIYQGVVKAWHIHEEQVDWWYVHCGVLKIALYDTRKESATYKELMECMLGDSYELQVLRVPPGVAHGYKCVSGPADIFYVTSHEYDGEDEGRIPYDDPEIGYDWLKSADIT